MLVRLGGSGGAVVFVDCCGVRWNAVCGSRWAWVLVWKGAGAVWWCRGGGRIARGFGLLSPWRGRDNSAAYQPLSAHRRAA